MLTLPMIILQSLVQTLTVSTDNADDFCNDGFQFKDGVKTTNEYTYDSMEI